MFIKSNPALKGRLIIRVLLTCMLLLSLSAASIPTQAGGPADKAKQALADWKAAQEAVKKARATLDEKRKKLQNVMAGHVESAKNKKKKDEPTPDDPALAQARKEVAEAEAALAAAEKKELAARVALESAIAELEDGPLKDQLKRERNYPTVVNANGLQTINFETQSGKLRVNLPNDMRAGDTISGTVIAEPKGATEEERNKNQSVLSGYVIEVSTPNHSSEAKVRAAKMFLPSNFRIEVGDLRSEAGTSERNIEVKLANNDGVLVQNAIVPFAPPIGFVITTSNLVKLPTIGQQGRPIEIPGPFDGSSENTTITLAGQEVPIIAESPRRAIFESPSHTTGPSQIVVKEGTTETKGAFRNLKIDLTAPKTSLLRGESTELHVEVSGLEGLTQPIPLHLTRAG